MYFDITLYRFGHITKPFHKLQIFPAEEKVVALSGKALTFFARFGSLII